MNRLEPKHPRAIRWMHWINAPLLTIMIWSGLLIYWANDVYSIRLGSSRDDERLRHARRRGRASESP